MFRKNDAAVAYPIHDHGALASELGIEAGDLVLDVGGGNNPFSFADVIVDIDFGPGLHRDGHEIPLDFSRHHYIRADLCHLPFDDNIFDHVICVQVLEHVEDPAAACEELMRVSRRGFLEVPRKWTEYYAGHPTHRWLIDEADGGLNFEPVSDDDFPFFNFALPPLWRSSQLQKALLKHRHISCIQMAWNERFRYRVRKEALASLADMHREDHLLARRHYRFAKNLLCWMTPPEHILFHAARALELMPKKPEYQFFYAFSLALSGRGREAAENGLSMRYRLYAIFFRFLLFSYGWIFNCFQKRLSPLLKQPKEDDRI